jgi:hypothetical protein
MSYPILYKGLTYPSLKKLVESEANDGLSYSVVMGRIKIGWDLDEALGKPRNKSDPRVTPAISGNKKALVVLSAKALIILQIRWSRR